VTEIISVGRGHACLAYTHTRSLPIPLSRRDTSLTSCTSPPPPRFPPPRWNNIVDQYGWSFVLSESGVRVGTSEYANETTVGTIKRWRCMQQGGECLQVGFLPYDKFPRHSTNWPGLAPKAMVYHLTHACAQEQAPCFLPHVRPFRGNRQRLSRYDENDFDEMVATLKGIGAWKVGAEAPEPFRVMVKDDATLRAA
jgi:hypothetical protein